jgi:hypothetical protein
MPALSSLAAFEPAGPQTDRAKESELKRANDSGWIDLSPLFHV